MKYLMTIFASMALLMFVACSDDSEPAAPAQDVVSDSSEVSDAAYVQPEADVTTEDTASSDVPDDAVSAPEADAAVDSTEE